MGVAEDTFNEYVLQRAPLSPEIQSQIIQRKRTQDQIDAVKEMFLNILPGTGEAMSAKDAVNIAQEPLVKDVTELGVIRNDMADRLGLSVLGAIPFVGGAVRTGKQGIKALSKVDDVKRGISALPMDEASRMARAKKLGITERAFHQTDAKNVGSITDEGFDLSKLGAREGETIMPDGVYLKPDDQDIGLHRNAEQMELLTNPGRQAKYIDREGLESHLMLDPKYSKLKISWDKKDAAYAKEFDEAFNKGFKSDADFEESEKITGKILGRWQKEQKETAAMLRQHSTDFLKREGFDSINVLRDKGTLGRETQTTVIFNPSKIRSPKAKFDPAKKSSANLLAGGAAAAIGINALSNRENGRNR